MGMAFIMLAHGFQGTLLGVRAVKENFGLSSTGFLFSGYFVGYFIGAKIIQSLIHRVGHIRVFAAFASVTSIVVLLHSIFVNPISWFVLRMISGFSMVCLYTIAESWLNDRSTNKNRGSVLSIYMIVMYASMAIGMFFINFSKPEKLSTFYTDIFIYVIVTCSNIINKKKSSKF